MKRKMYYIGATFKTNEGCIIKIINIISSLKVIIEFQDEYHYKREVSINDIRMGKIKNPYFKSICGVGYLGLTHGNSNGKRKQSYDCWKRMIQRCYSNFEDYNKNYHSCYVCDEWLCYENFEKWYDENYYNVDKLRMELDKDILVKGNKLYSPQTCVFVPNRINSLFVKKDANRGKLPIGVYKKNNKYMATLNKSLGSFDNELDAFYAYKKAKEQYIKQIADEYKDKIPQKLYDAMYRYEVEITD